MVVMRKWASSKERQKWAERRIMQKALYTTNGKDAKGAKIAMRNCHKISVVVKLIWRNNRLFIEEVNNGK